MSAQDSDSMRQESDSFGVLDVPVGKYWGAQTARSLINFPIGREHLPPALIHALGAVKLAAAKVNMEEGRLPEDLARPFVRLRLR